MLLTRVTMNLFQWYPRISEVRKRLHAPTPSKPKMEMRIDTPSEKSSLLRFKPKLRFRRSTNGKWPTMPITWGMSPYPWNYPPAYLRHGLNDTLAQAFKVWAEVSAIKFQFKDKMPVDIEIGFNIGKYIHQLFVKRLYLRTHAFEFICTSHV